MKGIKRKGYGGLLSGTLFFAFWIGSFSVSYGVRPLPPELLLMQHPKTESEMEEKCDSKIAKELKHKKSALYANLAQCKSKVGAHACKVKYKRDSHMACVKGMKKMLDDLTLLVEKNKAESLDSEPLASGGTESNN